MWNVYQVENYFDAVMAGVYETLGGHCEKGAVLGKPRGADRPAWFRVSPDTKDGLRVDGVSGLCRFRFIRDRRGARLSEEFHSEPKRVFYDFLMMIQEYRKSRGLSPLDLGCIYAFTKEGSPAVNGRNYAAFSRESASMRLFQGLLERKFGGAAASMLFVQYYITVFAENAKTQAMPPEYVPVCAGFLADFKRCYGFHNVLLFGVKTEGKQHVYFAVKGTGLFYNTEDGSGAFLEKAEGRLTLLLTVVPDGAGRKEQEAAQSVAQSTAEKKPPAKGTGRHDYEYRTDRKGFRLYVNGKKSKMALYPADRGPVPEMEEITPKEAKTPRDWIARGATSGARGGRLYRSLDAALEGEKALVESLFRNGNSEAVFDY
jgi:hypothetical protein